MGQCPYQIEKGYGPGDSARKSPAPNRCVLATSAMGKLVVLPGTAAVPRCDASLVLTRAIVLCLLGLTWCYAVTRPLGDWASVPLSVSLMEVAGASPPPYATPGTAIAHAAPMRSP
eukprot:965613-Rhodomonas_salina.1